MKLWNSLDDLIQYFDLNFVFHIVDGELQSLTPQVIRGGSQEPLDNFLNANYTLTFKGDILTNLTPIEGSKDKQEPVKASSTPPEERMASSSQK